MIERFILYTLYIIFSISQDWLERERINIYFQFKGFEKFPYSRGECLWGQGEQFLTPFLTIFVPLYIAYADLVIVVIIVKLSDLSDQRRLWREKLANGADGEEATHVVRQSSVHTRVELEHAILLGLHKMKICTINK